MSLETTMEVCKLKMSSSNEEEEEDQVKYQHHHIPHNLLTDEILARLPLESLLRFKYVSKLWYATLSSYTFAKTHIKSCPFSHSSAPTQCLVIQAGYDYYLYFYDDDNLEFETYYGRKGLVELKCDFDAKSDRLLLVGSCNGLVCLASYPTKGYFIIWNPFTNQYRKIFDPYLGKSSKIRNVTWGFGYTSSVDDYKIVRIIELPKTLEIVVHVFSLGANEWKRIGDEMYQHLFSLSKKADGMTRRVGAETYGFLFETHLAVLVNETLHWIVSSTEDWGRKIVIFDLTLETFDEFPHLELKSTEVYRDRHRLCVMGGCLSAIEVDRHDDVYINMLRSPGVQDYIRLFNDTRMDSYIYCVGFTRTGKLFITNRYSTELELVDPRSSPVKFTPLESFRNCGYLYIANHVPSLISPIATTRRWRNKTNSYLAY